MDKKQLQQLIIILPVILIAGIISYYKFLLAPLSEKKKVLSTELENIKLTKLKSLHELAFSSSYNSYPWTQS